MIKTKRVYGITSPSMQFISAFVRLQATDCFACSTVACGMLQYFCRQARRARITSINHTMIEQLAFVAGPSRMYLHFYARSEYNCPLALDTVMERGFDAVEIRRL